MHDRVADDFKDGIGAVTDEVYGEDTPENRRKVYRQLSEVRADERLRGIFKVAGKVCCIPSIVRADLRRRAEAAGSMEPAGAQRSPELDRRRARCRSRAPSASQSPRQ